MTMPPLNLGDHLAVQRDGVAGLDPHDVAAPQVLGLLGQPAAALP